MHPIVRNGVSNVLLLPDATTLPNDFLEASSYLHQSKQKTIEVTPVSGGSPGSLGLGVSLKF